MRILMLGNSFTFTNDLFAILAEFLDAELSLKKKICSRMQYALENEFWDYVVLRCGK